MDLPSPMTAAAFYDQLRAGSVCEINRAAGRVRVRVQGACLSGDRIFIGDKHGRLFRLSLADPVVMIVR